MDGSGGGMKRIWVGRVMSGLAGLFLLMDGVMKLFKPREVVEATVQFGYPESVIFGLGCVLTACTALYLIPRTSILGALLLTGYLGGAVSVTVIPTTQPRLRRNGLVAALNFYLANQQFQASWQ